MLIAISERHLKPLSHVVIIVGFNLSVRNLNIHIKWLR